MIEFMLLGLPRSGTAWASVWLGGPPDVLHDPLCLADIGELDSLGARGVCCTGLYLFPEWVNAHPARKLVLVRDPGEVRESLRRAGRRPALWRASSLHRVAAPRAPWTDLFDPARAGPIHEHLTGRPMCPDRHRLMAGMRVEDTGAPRGAAWGRNMGRASAAWTAVGAR